MQTPPVYARSGTQRSASKPGQDPLGPTGLPAVDPAAARGFRRHLPAVALAFGAAVITLNLIVAIQVGAGS